MKTKQTFQAYRAGPSRPENITLLVGDSYFKVPRKHAKFHVNPRSFGWVSKNQDETNASGRLSQAQEPSRPENRILLMGNSYFMVLTKHAKFRDKRSSFGWVLNILWFLKNLMSAPVTLLFVQNVYIGEGWELSAPCLPTRLVSDQGSLGYRGIRSPMPCTRVKLPHRPTLPENQATLDQHSRTTTRDFGTTTSNPRKLWFLKKIMFVPVTWLFGQNVYIGEGWESR